MTRKSAIGAAFSVIASALGLYLPGHASSMCTLRPATTWYTTITAGSYRLLFDDDADLAATPQVQHARHGNSFVTNTDSFRIAGPSGTCWASPEVGIVTMPVFIGNGRYLYIPTYSGGDAYLFVVDAATCKTIWQSPDMDGDAVRTHDGFFLPGAGHVVGGFIAGGMNRPYPCHRRASGRPLGLDGPDVAPATGQAIRSMNASSAKAGIFIERSQPSLSAR